MRAIDFDNSVRPDEVKSIQRVNGLEMLELAQSSAQPSTPKRFFTGTPCPPPSVRSLAILFHQLGHSPWRQRSPIRGTCFSEYLGAQFWCHCPLGVNAGLDVQGRTGILRNTVYVGRTISDMFAFRT